MSIQTIDQRAEKHEKLLPAEINLYNFVNVRLNESLKMSIGKMERDECQMNVIAVYCRKVTLTYCSLAIMFINTARSHNSWSIPFIIQNPVWFFYGLICWSIVSSLIFALFSFLKKKQNKKKQKTCWASYVIGVKI